LYTSANGGAAANLWHPLAWPTRHRRDTRVNHARRPTIKHDQVDVGQNGSTAPVGSARGRPAAAAAAAATCLATAQQHSSLHPKNERSVVSRWTPSVNN